MSTISQIAKQDDGAASAESKGSSAPLLNSNQQAAAANAAANAAATEPKPRKRDFWKFGKSKEENKSSEESDLPTSQPRPSARQLGGVGGLRPASPIRSTDVTSGTVSPHRVLPYGTPASPRQLASASPRPHSPASSMIFERSVQDEVHPPEMSPQIPSHVITENHIPPALDASTEAITDSRLDPDAVEIVTHATHQPAAVTITGAEHPLAASMHAEDHALSVGVPTLRKQETDSGSNYGSIDSADVRRLSFVSFADVVHAEQEMAGDQRRDSAYLIGTHPSLGPPRSPSPIRSPVSSPAFGTSPPTSVATSAGRGPESSPNRHLKSSGSPGPGAVSPMAAEYNVETMRQALRRTGSGDWSGVRSAPHSAVGDAPPERPF